MAYSISLSSFCMHLSKIGLRFIRYNVVKITTFAADIGLVYVLTSVLGVHYLLSVVVGFFFATSACFFMNRAWTFRKWAHPVRGIACASSVAASTLVVIAAVTYLGVEFIGIHYVPARIIAAIVAGVWSYAGDCVLTFRVHPLS